MKSTQSKSNSRPAKTAKDKPKTSLKTVAAKSKPQTAKVAAKAAKKDPAGTLKSQGKSAPKKEAKPVKPDSLPKVAARKSDPIAPKQSSSKVDPTAKKAASEKLGRTRGETTKAQPPDLTTIKEENPSSATASSKILPAKRAESAPKSPPPKMVPGSQPKVTMKKPALPAILFEADPPTPPKILPRPVPPVPSASTAETAAEIEPETKPESKPLDTIEPATEIVLVDPAPTPFEPTRLSGKLMLVAQNPETLFVYCDMAGSALEQARREAIGNRLYIRIHPDHESDATSQPSQELEFPTGTQGVFVPIPRAESVYKAELGGYADDERRVWISLLISEPAAVPKPDIAPLVAEDARFGDILYLLRSAVEKQIPLVEVVQHLHLTGQLRTEEIVMLAELPWPPDHASMLKELGLSAKDWSRPSSMEFLKPLPAPKQAPKSLLPSRHRKMLPTSPKPGAELGAGQFQGDKSGKEFWFNVNVEIVVYGATEPGAEVKIAGRPIKLSRDGSFSVRYALPDGAYGMDASATAADRSEERLVHLHFSRATAKDGEVGTHPQDTALRPPG